MKLGHLATVSFMLFACSLTVFTLNGWRLLSITLLLGVGNMVDLMTTMTISTYSCSYFGISSAFCSNTSSLPLSATIVPYISPRTISFTISLWSSNHPGALKHFTAVPENVIISMTGWHQDSPSMFLTQHYAVLLLFFYSVLQHCLDTDVDERTSLFRC